MVYLHFRGHETVGVPSRSFVLYPVTVVHITGRNVYRALCVYGGLSK